MRFLVTLIGLVLVVSLCDAAVVQRRTYRNTEEILVPVAIIQDGEEIKESPDLRENVNGPQNKNLRTDVVPDVITKAVEEEQKLEVVEAAVQEAQRRIDEAVVEEEIKEAVQGEQVKETIKALEEENTLTLAEQPQIVSVVQSENNEAIKEPAQEPYQAEKVLDYKSVAVDNTQTPNQVIVLIEASNGAANADAEQPQEGSVRQATQATPLQTTTQQNFVQQLIQNSPLGQFFNQITGQTTQSQVVSDETLPAPAPTLPGLFNPVTAVQNAAQSVVNSTTQAFQGLQQFASNLGNQFQSTLSSLGGQQPDQVANDATTARPPGPIQQLVNTFIGTPQQPAPTQQGPLQGLLNIFQGTNRPQGAADSANPAPQPAKEPEIQEDTQAVNNDLRDSAESNDSFEDSVQPGELIVVNDDVDTTENEQLQQVPYVSK